MAHPSPLAGHHERAGALASAWAVGAPDPSRNHAPEGEARQPIAVVECYVPVELEYAALRKACVVLDHPQRAVVEVTGSDRLDFLDRMFTQRVRDLKPGEGRWSFWLNRKGRIDADVRVLALPDRVLLDTDAHAAPRLLATLGAYLITEDAALADRTMNLHRLALHGPRAPAVLDVARTGWAHPDQIIADRDDRAGVPGLELTLPTERAAEVYESLLAAGARPAGWHAFNIARIEAGTALYYLDFGPDSLPHETGVLRERVDFRKGCYLGQEIVARMESRGPAKQRLVAIRLADDAGDAQPTTGAAVLAEQGDEQVGAVTSSTVSPMLGGVPVCFAMVRAAHTQPGVGLRVRADRGFARATVQPTMRFVEPR